MDWDKVKEQMVRTICNTSDSFLMPIEDVFSIFGRGTVVTGCIESGFICVWDNLEMVGFNAASIKVRCAGIETLCKMVDRAEQELNVGVFFERC